MIRPLVTTVDEPADRSPMMIFAAVQLVLLAAIPVLSWVGANSVLQSRDGRFVEQPLPGEPGWIADVDPTPTALALVVENGVVVGAVAVAALGSDTSGGTMILLPPSTPVGGVRLGDLSPVRAGPELAAELGWTFGEIDVLDAVVWAQAMGSGTITLDNPDPVLDAEGVLAFAVGTVELDAAAIGPYLAGPLGAPGAAAATAGAEAFRHRLFWSALLEDGLARPAVVSPVLAAALDTTAMAAGSTDAPGTVLVDLPDGDEARASLWRSSLGVLAPSAQHPAVIVTLPAGVVSVDAALSEMTAAGLAVRRVEIEDRPAGDGREVVAGDDLEAAAEVAARLGPAVSVVDDGEAASEAGLRSLSAPLVRLSLAAPSLG